MTTLAQAQAFLESRSMPVGNLRALPRTTQNSIFTDGKTYLLKAYQDAPLVAEPFFADWARSHGMNVPLCLGSEDHFTLWEFVPMEPMPLSALKDVLPKLRELHQAPLPASSLKPFPYQVAKERVCWRFKQSSHPQADLYQQEALQLMNLVESLSAARPQAFIHGDLQFKNMGLSGNTPVVFDWELACAGPVELELSRLTENLLSMGERPHEWLTSYGPWDEELLLAATGMRFIQAVAFQLVMGQEKLAETKWEAYRNFAQSSGLVR